MLIANGRVESMLFGTYGNYLHGTRPVIACSQFCPSKRLISSVAMSTPSRQRTFTLILSGAARGT